MGARVVGSVARIRGLETGSSFTWGSRPRLYACACFAGSSSFAQFDGVPNFFNISTAFLLFAFSSSDFL